MEDRVPLNRRELVGGLAAAAVVARAQTVLSQPASGMGVQPEDRVFICNEDSNTLSVIDPRANTVETTVNLTSFDEDPRPPFRFVTGGVAPTHAGMVQKPLYHGAISIHGAAPSPDNSLIATTGRGTSNVYLIDTRAKKVLGGRPNPQARDDTNAELISTGVLVGREPHEPTFTRNGKELWVTVRGENRIAIIDVAAAREGKPDAVRGSVDTLNGPAQVWFSADGKTAFVVSQKGSAVDVLAVEADASGVSRPRKLKTIDIKAQDPFGFTPFLKTSPDGKEVWLSHKLADAVSVLDANEPFQSLETVALGRQARPNHVEFVENARGKVVYASLARVDDNGPGGVASSQIAIIDRSAPAGQRKVTGSFFSHGREAHGLWVNPENSLLYVAHEQDELPNTPNAGQTVCSAFEITDPFNPRHIAQIALGELALPSGKLRNKKSINLVYVRPGAKSQTA
jgi:YVTN family beta-propeller protein